jgi:hypothetical protein
VTDDLDHLRQSVLFIEPQLPDLDLEGASLQIPPWGEATRSLSGEATLRGATDINQPKDSLCNLGRGPEVLPPSPDAAQSTPPPSGFPACSTPRGWGRFHSRLHTVGSGQHPLRVDVGAATHVFPPVTLPAVEPQADLPREPPG